MRAVLLMVLIMCASCAEKDNNSVQVAKNKEIVQQFFEHFNNHDWQKMANIYVENAEFKDPSLGKKIVKMTKSETAEKYAGLNKIFPDLHDRIINTYPSGNNSIIVEFVSTGTGPDGSKFELPICTIFTIENGKITKDYTYFDNSQD